MVANVIRKISKSFTMRAMAALSKVSQSSPASPEKRKNGRMKSPPMRGAIMALFRVVQEEA